MPRWIGQAYSHCLAFQNMYWVFLVAFITIDAAMIRLCLRLAFFCPERSKEYVKVFYAALFSYLLIGVPVWILDMLM